MRNKKIMILLVSAILILAMSVGVLSSCNAKLKTGNATKVTQIELSDDGMIRVLQLTDLHLTKGSSKKEDKQTFKWLDEAVRYARPDIVAITGDAVGGAYGRNNAVIELANFFEERNIYWMYTFGNHDGEWRESDKVDVGKLDSIDGRLEILDLLKGYEYSLMTKGETDGVGNYIINVVNAKNEVVHSFVNMDTHGKLYQEVDGELKDKGYIGLKANQLDWYKQEMAKLEGKGVEGALPFSTLFMHVPLVEYRDAWKNTPHVGGFEEINLERKVYAPDDNNNIGFFNLLKEIGSTKLMSVGHDHDFNWLRDYEGIYMSYGRVSGVNAWGRRAPIGATIIDINPYAQSKEAMYRLSVIEPTFEYSKWEGEKWD